MFGSVGSIKQSTWECFMKAPWSVSEMCCGVLLPCCRQVLVLVLLLAVFARVSKCLGAMLVSMMIFVVEMLLKRSI